MILILLVESGLIFLVIQVSYLISCFSKFSGFKFWQTVYLLINVCDFHTDSIFQSYGFASLYFSLAVSVAQAEDSRFALSSDPVHLLL